MTHKARHRYAVQFVDLEIQGQTRGARGICCTTVHTTGPADARKLAEIEVHKDWNLPTYQFDGCWEY